MVIYGVVANRGTISICVSDITKSIPDTRPGAAKSVTRKANVFKWQAASEAERKSEEFIEIMNNAAGQI